MFDLIPLRLFFSWTIIGRLLLDLLLLSEKRVLLNHCFLPLRILWIRLFFCILSSHINNLLLRLILSNLLTPLVTIILNEIISKIIVIIIFWEVCYFHRNLIGSLFSIVISFSFILFLHLLWSSAIDRAGRLRNNFFLFHQTKTERILWKNKIILFLNYSSSFIPPVLPNTLMKFDLVTFSE